MPKFEALGFGVVGCLFVCLVVLTLVDVGAQTNTGGEARQPCTKAFSETWVGGGACPSTVY